MGDEFDARTETAFRAITHGCDGPLTPHVMISRAIEMARNNGPAVAPCYVPLCGMCDPIATALGRALEAHGLLAGAIDGD